MPKKHSAPTVKSETRTNASKSKKGASPHTKLHVKRKGPTLPEINSSVKKSRIKNKQTSTARKLAKKKGGKPSSLTIWNKIKTYFDILKIVIFFYDKCPELLELAKHLFSSL